MPEIVPRRLALVEARAERCGRCGCDRDRHDHHHDKTYCGTCGKDRCPWFRRPRARRGRRPVRQALVITAVFAAAPPLGCLAVWLYAQIWGW